MAKARHLARYLVVSFLSSSINLCCHAMHPQQGPGKEVFLAVVRGECLRRCRLSKEFDSKTNSRSLYGRAPQDLRDSTCYRNCINHLYQQSPNGRKRKNRHVRATGVNYECSSDDQTTDRKLGDVQNLTVAFLQQRSNDDNVTWIANVTWDVFLLTNRMNLDDEWKGFLLTWLKSNNEHTTSTNNNCRIILKNNTNFIIKSGTSDWVYPDAIDIGVSMYPTTKEINENGFALTTFDPRASKNHDKTLTKKRSTTTKPITTQEANKKSTKKNTTTKPNLTTQEPNKKSVKKSSPTLQQPRILAIVLGCSGGVIIVCMVLYLIWKRRNKLITVLQDQETFKYDASILYSSHDEKWVTEELVPLLETENNFKCFIHFRDFEVGAVIHENMANAVYKCRKNLAVVSENFLKSNYCKDELDMALERVQRCRDCSLIIVNLDGVPIEKLPKALRIRTFVNLRSSQEQKTWKNRLVRQISQEDDYSKSKSGDKKLNQKSVIRVTSEGCQVINHINDLTTSSSETVI